MLKCLELVKEDQEGTYSLDLFKWQEGSFMEKNAEIRANW